MFLSSSQVPLTPARTAIRANPPSLRWPVCPSLQFIRPQRSSIPFAGLDINGGQGFHEVELKVRDYELISSVSLTTLYMPVIVSTVGHYSLLTTRRHELLETIGIDCDAVARSCDALALSDALRSGDKIVVKVWISGASAARIYVDHYIYKLPNRESIVEAKATALWLDRNYRPVRIPHEIRSKLVQFNHHKESN